jgi:hypothetical protein
VPNFRFQYQENVSTKLLFNKEIGRNVDPLQNRKSSQQVKQFALPKKKDLESINMGVVGHSNMSTNLSSS